MAVAADRMVPAGFATRSAGPTTRSRAGTRQHLSRAEYAQHAFHGRGRSTLRGEVADALVAGAGTAAVVVIMRYAGEDGIRGWRRVRSPQ